MVRKCAISQGDCSKNKPTLKIDLSIYDIKIFPRVQKTEKYFCVILIQKISIVKYAENICMPKFNMPNFFSGMSVQIFRQKHIDKQISQLNFRPGIDKSLKNSQVNHVLIRFQMCSVIHTRFLFKCRNHVIHKTRAFTKLALELHCIR